jgi:hypothetical protein
MLVDFPEKRKRRSLTLRKLDHGMSDNGSNENTSQFDLKIAKDVNESGMLSEVKDEIDNKSHPPNNTTSLLEMELEIGHLSGSYTCCNNHIQGMLYAGSDGFGFKGSIFFYTHLFSFQWDAVIQVQHSALGHIIIQVRENSKDNSLTFSGIQHAERVWATLSALHSEAKLGSPGIHQLLTPMRASLRRLATDPTSLQSTKEHEQQSEAAYVAAATVATMEDLRLTLSSRRLTVNVPHPEEPDSDLEEAWRNLHDTSSKSYKENAFQDQNLSCSLDKFQELFLNDEAPYSITSFMLAEGDSNVIASHWKEQDSPESGSFSRTIEYTHPINAPLAPPNAKARKEQRMRRFVNQGISIETDTYVDDVPMTDCFYVTDRILIQANEDKTVTLSAYFDIRFVKSTMFRSIITNTTRSELTKWFQNLLVMFRQKLIAINSSTKKIGDLTIQTTFEKPVEAVLRVSPTSSSQVGNKSDDRSNILIILLTLVILLQGLIHYRLSSVERSLNVIQSHRAEVCILPTIVRNAVLNTQECQETLAELATLKKEGLMKLSEDVNRTR